MTSAKTKILSILLALSLFSILTADETEKAKEDKMTPTTESVEEEEEESKKQEDAELKKIKRETEKLTAILALKTAKHKENLIQTRQMNESLDTEIKLRSSQLKLKELKLKETLALHTAEVEKLKVRSDNLSAQIKIRELELKKLLTTHQGEIKRMESDMKLRTVRKQWKGEINQEIQRKENPFNLENQTLYVSDRRISLNDTIFYSTAEYVTERINFFNNQSKTDPIFIIIDWSPGGSVMAGYRILQSIKSSDAPVYVVLKSFAASMAAMIVTLADRSYAYPNAILLHHQVSAGSFGNTTQHEEFVKMIKEWQRRLLEPVAKKMGLSIAEIIKQMYEHNSTGDWEEFADKAVKLKWVNNLVTEIREASIRRNPDMPIKKEKKKAIAKAADERIDTRGNPYIKLPKLRPFDVYHIYNPNNYYR